MDVLVGLFVSLGDVSVSKASTSVPVSLCVLTARVCICELLGIVTVLLAEPVSAPCVCL